MNEMTMKMKKTSFEASGLKITSEQGRKVTRAMWMRMANLTAMKMTTQRTTMKVTMIVYADDDVETADAAR